MSSSASRYGLPPGRPALVVGHPGHELRVHHWLELVRPVVFVITDGSGHHPSGRLGSTTAVLQAAGATPGSIYGRFADREVYRRLVERDVRTFQALASELAAALAALEVEYVVADAAEGFNPTHDLCRYVTDAAVAQARLMTGRDIPAYEFDLDASPDAAAHVAFALDLDAAALERKVAAGLGYVEMRGEVEAMLQRYGSAPFGVERFRPAISGQRGWCADEPATYERFGRERLASGYYQTLITYIEHLAPVQDALGQRSASPTTAS